jgi:hypothetical protein
LSGGGFWVRRVHWWELAWVGGLWEIEGLVLKAVSPIKTPTIPVMISFFMVIGEILLDLGFPD